MTYEIVSLEQKTVLGFSDVTNNASPDMGEKIASLWQKLYSGTAQSQKNRTNKKSIGLYCDYKQNGDYTVLAGCEVSSIFKFLDFSSFSKRYIPPFPALFSGCLNP